MVGAPQQMMQSGLWLLDDNGVGRLGKVFWLLWKFILMVLLKEFSDVEIMKIYNLSAFLFCGL